ncbi:MAG: secretin, partial [Thermotogae bacterium]|nr:secretin [Thermotogota bacterium]
GSAYVDEKNNLLIVTGIDEEQKKKLDEFIEELSAPPPQVSIEARMVDKNLTDSILKDLGIEIAMTNPIVKVSKDGVNIYTGVMSELEFAKFMEKFTETLQASATLNANKSDSQGETLSSPHIMTLSGNAAKILVGQRVPYIVSVGEEQEALQFIDIGMELNITPYVRADGTIELDVSAKVSNVVSWKKGRNGEDLPVESTREARTKVVIKDGETLVIGGLTTKDQSDSISKLPILGDLPFVGQLFRTVSKRDEKRELVIFITAKIAKR